MVFWAAIKPDWIPSDILKDRLKITYRAYKLWKVKKIIVSGDNSRKNYNEPVAMQIYLLDLWVNEDDIYLDYAWFDTYDSLYRVKEIFQINSITLFTQDFHLKRAMYISKRLGINTLWVKTNILRYIREDYYNLREIPARIKAFLEVEIFKTKPKFLWEKIEILTDEKIERIKNTIKK